MVKTTNEASLGISQMSIGLPRNMLVPEDEVTSVEGVATRIDEGISVKTNRSQSMHYRIVTRGF